MADSKKPSAAAGPPTHAEAKQPTEGSLKQADKESGPYIGDAEPQDEPVRSVSPQAPMVQTLTVGAGRHEPPTDPHIGVDGRWYADTADAEATKLAVPAPPAGNA